MRRILIGLTILGAGALIVLGARKALREHAGAAPAASVATTGEVGSAGRAGVPGAEGTTEEAKAPGTTGAAGEIAAPGVGGRDGEVGGAAPEAVRAGARPGDAARSDLASTGTVGAAPVTTGGQAPLSSAAGTVRTDRGPTHPVEAPAPLTAAEDPEIAAVLRRAAGVYAGARSLQADFSQRSMNPILRTTVASQGTLYQRRPDRFLMRFSDPAGDLIVSDGSHFWVFYPSVDRKQVLRMPASMGAGGVDLQAQFVGDPLERFTAVSEGREEISGRSSYVLLLTPRQPIGYRSLKIWVDPEDYLVRRFEVTEESGIVRHFELSNLRLNPTLSDDLFRFTPPEGAQVVDRG